MRIVIKTNSEKEMFSIKNALHNILAGNPDYIHSNIILNGSDDRQDGTINEVHLLIKGDERK